MKSSPTTFTKTANCKQIVNKWENLSNFHFFVVYIGERDKNVSIVALCQSLNADKLDRIKEVWYTTISGTLPTTDSAYDGYTYSRKEAYHYDEAGNISALIDYVAKTKTVYTFDADGKPIQAIRYNNTAGTVSAVFAQGITYTSEGLVSSLTGQYLLNGAQYSDAFTYVYDAKQRLTTMYYGSSGDARQYQYTYDGLDRVTMRKLTYGGLTVTQTLGYVNGANSQNSVNATGRVGSLTSKVGSTTTNYSYTYDDRGNITRIYIGGVLKYSYTYDNLNQLTRENNAVANKTYVYTYDDAGNILTKKTYAYTTGTLGSVQSTYNYTYGNSQWGDQLTAYRGTTITYDALGNPKSYYNGASYSLGWTKGRQLSSVLYGSATTTFHYNADGIRTKKVGSTTVEYVLDGTKILAEKNGDMVITYIYDPQGAPVGMKISGTTYLYEKNLQGDIVGIYTTGGTKVATYAYDAWGKLISSSYTSGYYTPYYYNPFRYRGYYYDVETGFYYLQSRYYDPTTGRFLNADIHINANGDLQGFNMYAYCSNNPIMYVDPNGEGFFSDIFNKVEEAIKQTYNDIVDFIDYANETAKKNTTIELAFGIGMYFENDSVDVGSRMDIIAVEYSDGEWKIGHDGRSSLALSTLLGKVGPQSDTYETFDNERTVSGPYQSDIDISVGVSKAVYFVGGYRYNFSFSILGFITDMLEYLE